MPLPGRTSEVLPFTLTEIFVLLVFLLLLLFLANERRIPLAQRCLDSMRDGQECIPVDPSQVPEPGQELVSVDPSQVPEPGETLISVDTSQVPEEGEELVSVDSSQVPGPEEALVALDSNWVKLFECNPEEQSCGNTEEILRCLEELGPGQECLPFDSSMIVVDSVFRGLIDVIDSAGVDPDDYSEFISEFTSEFTSEFINIEPGACWREPEDDPDGEVVHAFEVDIEPDRLTFKKVWPPRYDAAAAMVPGLTDLSEAGTIDFATYRAIGQRVLDWSDDQSPPCRHYVDIYYSLNAFRSEPDPIGAAMRIQGFVEDFLYKLRNARARSNQ